MILSAAEDRTMVITKANMEQAITECCKLLPNYKVLSQTIAVDASVKVGALILRELLMEPGHKLSIKQLLQRLWVSGLDKQKLSNLLETYKEAGLVKGEMDHETTDQMIILTETAIAKYKETKGI